MSRYEEEEAIKRLKDLYIMAELNRHEPEMEKDMQSLKMAIKSLENTRWIPVSERLPEENVFYLATIYSKGMQTAFCDILFYGAPQLCENRKIGWYFMHDNGEVEQVFNVKAWMQLPEAWKESEVEE